MGALAVVAVIAASTACAPTHAVSVGSRDIATDILLKGAPAPAGLVAPPPVQPGFPLAPVPAALPQPRSSVVALPPVLPPVPAQTCPTASPLVGARDPATPLPAGPPVAHTSRFRQSGTFRVGSGRGARSGAFGPALTHTIKDVARMDGGWTYTDVDSAGMTTVYDVYPRQRVAPQEPVTTNGAAAQPTQAGIYVRSFTYVRADRTRDSLAPQPELLVAPLPLDDAGASWRARGVDPRTGIAVIVDGQVGLGPSHRPLMDRIDACGNVLQAYWVEYTIASDNSSTTGVSTGGAEPPSSLRGSDLDVEFVGTQVAFATQYGGIPLEQLDRVRGTDGGLAVDVTRHEVIAQAPPRSSS